MIYLCIRNPIEQEFHIKYEGHETVESANTEITFIRNKLVREGKKPFDCYIYEAETPPYGQKAYLLDEVDFNFYQEKTEEEIQESLKVWNQKVAEVKKLAQEEQEKFGGNKVV
jgi:hypothetical protein